MVDIDFGIISGVFYIVLSITAVGALFWRSMLWLRKKALEDAERRVNVEEEKAKRLREYTDQKAVELRTITEKVAVDLQSLTQRLATEQKDNTARLALELKDNTARMAVDVKENNAGINKDIVALIKEIEGKLMITMKDIEVKLTTRANMTNGNVSNIRKDLLELSKDIEDLYYYNDTHSGNGSITSAVRQRQNAKKRKRRLSQINRDRRSQDHPDTTDRGEEA